jgi:TonB-linked SusC/RagA family outer membrane protein
MKKFRDYFERNSLEFLSKKTIRVMKLTLFLSFLTISQLWATETYSQITKLSLKLEDVKISDALTAIENQSEFFFLYSPKLIDVESKVTIDIKDEPIKDILPKILGNNIKFAVYDQQIILSPIGQSGAYVEFQQQNRITGTVTDAGSGGTLPGVNVVVKGTNIGAQTDINGRYSLMVPDANAELVFSFIGYNILDEPASGRTTINVALTPTTQSLDEVIVVGYGTKKKRDITGSISSISAKSLVQSAPESIAQGLQGKVAGVYVKSNSGQPGGGVSVRIRGIGGLNNSEPLFIVDGIQMVGGTTDTYNSLAMINPNDIESMEVLKDASAAAIYGARAANGVVIITTKRGATGKPQVSYSATFGIQNLINPNNFGVLNAKEYAEVVNETVMADGLGAIFGGTNTVQYPVQYFPAPSTLGAGTDWIDEITHKNAPTQEHQLSVSGGNENHKYYLSLNYLNESGIIINTSFKH